MGRPKGSKNKIPKNGVAEPKPTTGKVGRPRKEDKAPKETEKVVSIDPFLSDGVTPKIINFIQKKKY